MPNDSFRIRPLTAAFAVALFLQGIGALPAIAADPEPLITATLDDALPAANRKNPGESITYTATVTNSPASTASGVGVSVDLPTPPGTTIVPSSVNISPIAYDDSFSAVGNTQLTVDSTHGLLWNDFDPDSESITVPVASVSRVSGTGTTQAAPGTLVVNPQGGFVYTPGVGAIGTERFQYTLRDGRNADSVAPGYVTFTISQPVWYVKAGATGSKTGRSHEPFDSPETTSLAANGDTDIIYVLASGSPLNGAFTLQNGQELRGQGTALAYPQTNPAFATPDPLITYFPATTPPSLTNSSGNTVTVGGSNTIRGVSFGNRSGAAISGNAFGTLTVTSDVVISGTGTALNLANGTLSASFASLSASAAATGINLTGINGTLTLNAGGLTGLSGDDLLIDGGNVVIVHPTTYTINNTSGRSIHVRNRSGANNVTFQCPITDSGTGILLDNNDGATVSFTGGLTLSGSATFSAINGGTVEATQNNSTIVNTINLPNSTALMVRDTTIGPAGLTFRSISSGASSNVGISLENTGSTGGLTVTGLDGADGGTDPDVGSGGTITGKTGPDGSNTSGTGIYLNHTSNVSLSGMQLSNFDNSAIRGISVTGFRLTHSTISGTIGNNTGATEGAITFGTSNPGGANGLLGSGASASLIDHVDVSGAIEHTLEFYNQSGSFGLTVSNSNIRDNSIAGGSDGILSEMQGTATATININNNTFTNNKSQAIQVAANDSSSVNLTITGNAITRGTQGNEGIVISNGSDGDLTSLVSNNTIAGFGSASIFVGQTPGNATASSLLQATLQGNIITAPATATDHAILGFLTSTLGQVSQARLLIDNNTVTQNSSGGLSGIFVTTPDADRTPNFDVTVTHNHVDVTDGVNGLRGIVVQATRGSGHFDVRENDVDYPNGNPGVKGLRVRQQTLTVLSTVDLARGISASSSATTVLSDNNPAAGGTEVLGAVSVINNGILQTPDSPPLPLLLDPAPLDANTAPASTGMPIHSMSAAVEASHHAANSNQAPPEIRLNQAQLDTMVAAARTRWEDTGLSSEQRAILRNLKIEVTDLPGLHLGEAAGRTIRLDSHAGGSGWFIDAGAGSDALFSTVKSPTRLHADPMAACAGRVDLLTTLMHEMGHAIGLPDTYSHEDRDSIMYGHLSKGERRLPAKDQAGSAQAPIDGVPRFLNGPFTMPDGRELPPGKSIRITYSVTINDPLTHFPIVSQGTVTGNFAEVKTDDAQSDLADPVLPGTADPTVTLIERPDTTVASINRTAASPSNLSSVSWQVVFADPISGLTAGNFTFANTGLSGTPSVSEVTAAGGAPATTWTISATTGTGDGTLGLNMVNDSALTFDMTNLPFTGQVYTLDRTGPGATVDLADSSLNTGETSLVTFTFTEPTNGFDLADLTIPNGNLSAPVTSDNIIWTATYTPLPSVTDATNIITLDKSGVTDALGNAGIGTAISGNFTVDTASPTATIVVSDTALRAGETSLVTFTFSEAVSGFAAADLAVANGVVSNPTTSDGGTTWTAILTPTASITDTSNLITLDNTGVTDQAGNPGTGTMDSNNYAIDTLRPTAAIIVADTALAAGETSSVTITFNEAVSGFSTVDLTISNGSVASLDSSDGGTTWTATLTPSAGVTDTTNLVTLDNTGITDLAGNSGTGTTDSNNYAIDTLRPSASLVLSDSFLTVGETAVLTVTFNEAVTGFTTADLLVANGSVSDPTTLDGGITWTCTLTPTPGVTDISNVITLDNSGVQDSAGNAGTGNTLSNNYSIDTARPTATILVADDNLMIGETSLVTIAFSEPVSGLSNADLMVDNGTLDTLATNDGGITWTATFTPTPNVTDPTNVITLDNTGVADAAGNPGTGTTISNNYEVTSLSVSITADAASSIEGTGGGTTAFTFTIARSGSTTGPLTVDYAVSGTADATDFGGTLPSGTFTIPDTQASAVLTINAGKDSTVEADEAFTVTLSNASGGYAISAAAASSTITNDDTANFAVTQSDGTTAVSEPATTDTVSIVLSAQPLTDVVFDVTSGDPTEATVSPAFLTFTPSNWNLAQSVTVTAADDQLVDGSQNSTITIAVNVAASDSAFDALDDQTVTVTTSDNDLAGFTIVQSGGTTAVTEPATTDHFTVVLNAQPLADVVLGVSSSDLTESSVSSSSLTFTTLNWNIAQTVTVSAVDDLLVDGPRNSTITVTINDASSDNAFDPVADQSITVSTADNETAGISIVQSGGTTEVSEPDVTDTFTVILTAQPLSDVVLAVAGSDDTEATVSTSALTFTTVNWNVAQTVTVAAADDVLVDGSVTSTIAVAVDDAASDDAFDPVADQTIGVTTADDDVASFVITQTGGATAVAEPGTSDTFTIRLGSQPLTNVVLDITGGDTTEANVIPSALTFTTANWNVAQTITVTAVDDVLVDGAVASTLTVSVRDATSDDAFDLLADQTVSVTTADNDVAGFSIVQSAGSTSVTEPDTTDTFTVVLTAQPLGNVVFDVSSSDTTESTVSSGLLTFTSANWNVAQTVTVSAADDFLVDGTISSTVTVAVSDASSDDAFDPLADQTVSVDTADNDVPGYAILESGGSTAVTEPNTTDGFTVVLTAQPLANVAFNVSSSDTTASTVSPAVLTFTHANWNVAQTVTVTAADDSRVDGPQTSTITVAVDRISSDNSFDNLADRIVSVTTADEDVLTLSISAADADADENSADTGIWRVTRNTIIGTTTVQIQVDAGSTATATDATKSGSSLPSLTPGSTGTVVIPAGQTHADITLTPTADIHAEADETIRFNLLADPSYTVGAQANATVTIGRNDFVVINTNNAGEGSLRQAMLNSNNLPGAETITFEGGVFTDSTVPDVIDLESLLPSFGGETTIAGPGADKLVIRRPSTAGSFSLMQVFGGADVSLSGLTLSGGSGGIANVGNLKLDRCTISGNSSSTYGGILNNGTLVVTHCTVSGNSSSSGVGGGIYNLGGRTLSVFNSTISGNSSANGGGGISIVGGSTVWISNSTVSGNTAGSSGAGILNSGALTVVNSTITGNSGTGQGGGIATSIGSSLTLANTIVAGNTASSGPDINTYNPSNVFSSNGANFIGIATGAAGMTSTDKTFASTGTTLPQLLAPLADNGGPTLTHALVNGSPAINGANNADIPPDILDLDGDTDTSEATPYDQRGSGFARVIGTTVDIGAWEAFAFEPGITAATTDEDVKSTTGLVITANPADGGLTSHYKITAVLNGTLYQNDGITAIAADGFVTRAQGAAGLKFLPAANLNSTNTSSFSFTVQAAVGAVDSGLRGLPQAASITVNPVNDAPTLVAPGLANQTLVIGSNLTVPLPVGFTDIDGDLLGFSVLANSNNSVASASIIGTDVVLDALASGTTNITILADDGRGGTITDTFMLSVGTVNPTPLQLGTTATLNRQNGLFEITVNVTNTTPYPINGFRLHVDYNAYKAAHPSLILFNASSTPGASGVYLEHPFPVAVDGVVTLTLSFYTNNRRFPSPFQPGLGVESLGTTQISGPSGAGVQPSLARLPGGSVRLEFPTVPGKWYRVRYSSDLSVWFTSEQPVQATGNVTPWTDNGPPYTHSDPAGADCRFYLINEIPAP